MAGKFRLNVFATYAFCCLASCSLSIGVSFADDESPQSKMTLIAGKTMGTTYHIKIQIRNDHVGAEQDQLLFDAEDLQAKIDQRLKEINQSMSTYLPDSEISRFNAASVNQPFAVSSDFACVASRALELHEMTKGRFDATVGPLVRFWGFGGGKAPAKIPTEAQIVEVLKRVGSNHLQLEIHRDTGDQIQAGSLTKTVADLEVDLSAIAKGYAVDEICRLLSDFSNNFMVEIGGEVRTKGRNVDSGQPWAIGIELPAGTPLELANNMAARLELDGMSLATSGDYRNLVMIEGQEFQHTIDPVDGRPVANGIHSVSVVCEDCMTADGLATGLMVHTLEEIKEFAKRQSLAVFVIYGDESGATQWWTSNEFTGQVLMPDEVDASTTRKAKESNPVYMILGAIVVFGLAIAGMAIGVILSNRQLKGSCGGLSAMQENGNGEGLSSPCSLCSKPASECSRRSEEVAETSPSE